VIDHSIKSIKNQRLGKLLHYQLPNFIQIYLKLKVKLPVFTHPYAHNNFLKSYKLACVKHITSVHFEPGPDSIFINF
jgi:hypothetical protein